MDKLPTHVPPQQPRICRRSKLRALLGLVILAASSASINVAWNWPNWPGGKLSKVPHNAQEILQTCKALHVLPAPPADFHDRTQSDRYEPGTPPVLLKNATIWTGRASGAEIVKGDILLDKGLIKAVGIIDENVLNGYSSLVAIDVGGKWVTPGIVDMHSHLGVDSVPGLKGSDDTNSFKGIVQPWLRSLDGLNTHDDAYRLSISGGVTTANVLPGSANAIGGQAFTIKLRPTTEKSSSSMLLEPPYTLNGTYVDPSFPPRWRQMKHACGENPSRVYSGTRMDTIWSFRQGYNTAHKIKVQQDEYCAKAVAGEWDGLGAFPEDLQWEALVDVLRGRVKVHNHCYEATDLDGTTPAVALFATNARYKREAYRGSEFAPKILADNGIKVVMKSDHPVLNSRYLLYEAQQAHYYGLPRNLALSSVTSTPATIIGMDHRIGFIKEGYDADVVVWDSHPLAIGATPEQVYIDGIAQLEKPYTNEKPSTLQEVPHTPDFNQEAADAVKNDGLPPLETVSLDSDTVVFTHLQGIILRRGRQITEVFSSLDESDGAVVVTNGTVVCAGSALSCKIDSLANDVEFIDLEGGTIAPALLSYGSPLALEHIQGEKSTKDGVVPDPLTQSVPSILGEGPVIKAADGLQFAARDSLYAYRSGVTTGVTAPTTHGFLSGLSVAFDTGAPHRLVEGAVVQEVAAIHVSIGPSTPSVSTQISALRRLLSGEASGELGVRFKEVVEGKLPLVVEVQSADIMASLIHLKQEIEAKTKTAIRLTFSGAAEAHLIAKEIGKAGVGVILTPSRPFPAKWESRRILPGPPLTETSAIATLIEHNVTVGIGIEEQWSARNLRFDVAWAALEAGGRISRAEALALASINLETLLGVETTEVDHVVTKGGSFLGFDGKVIGVVSGRRGTVELN
ncbi:hypothetical protein AX16_000743 [Volvariella volvacea WC 439]|nr:hypothetical protein AX16_000743 [Volvariella volvacea WC 439]